MVLPLTLALAQEPPRSTLPGCVADIAEDAAKRWGYGPAEMEALPSFKMRNVLELVGDRLDLDADGYPDWAVRGACLPSGACEETLYLSAWGCTRFAMRWTGTVRVVKETQTLAQELETREITGCDGKALIITDWLWVDGTYEERGGVTCACPAKKPARPEVRSGRCPAP